VTLSFPGLPQHSYDMPVMCGLLRAPGWFGVVCWVFLGGTRSQEHGACGLLQVLELEVAAKPG
jgi:hypothetical protein